MNLLLDKIWSGKATLKDQDEALKDPKSAYYFARDVKGADIEKCQEVVCKDPMYAFWFAEDIEGADIEKCQDVACKDPQWAYNFAVNIFGADIWKCLEACKGSEYEDRLNEHLMNKVLL